LRRRIIGIHRNGAKEFIRFYDFEDPLVGFNVLTVDWSGDSVRHNLQTTLLHPYLSETLKTALAAAEFANLGLSADMTFTPFDAKSSANLVITARKQ
jgi:hypothetical protein